jgi:hypothetical protein
MGIRCSCGVTTNPVVTGNTFVTFLDQPNVGTPGTVTISADACADRLNLGTASITFTNSPRSFEFTSITITSVICSTIGDTCQIVVSGTGLVTGENTPRQFTIIFMDQSGIVNDSVIFSIDGFAIGNFQVPPGSFTVTGCPAP